MSVFLFFRYEYMRSQLSLLQKKIMNLTGRVCIYLYSVTYTGHSFKVI